MAHLLAAIAFAAALVLGIGSIGAVAFKHRREVREAFKGRLSRATRRHRH